MGWVWCNGMLGHFTPVFLRPWFGVVTGIAVVVGAAMLYADPARARQWGLIIILASAISAFFGMGGLLAGLLGIVGGALAISAGNGGRPPLTRAQNEA